MLIPTHTHTQIHAHTHTKAHTHTHAHTHTNTHRHYPDLHDITFLTLQNAGKVYYRHLHWNRSFDLPYSAFWPWWGSTICPSSNWFNFHFWTHCLKPLFLYCPWTSQCRARVGIFAFNELFYFRSLPLRDFPLKKWPTHESSCSLLPGSNPSLCLVNPVCLIAPHTTLAHTHTHTHTHTRSHAHTRTHTHTSIWHLGFFF